MFVEIGSNRVDYHPRGLACYSLDSFLHLSDIHRLIVVELHFDRHLHYQQIAYFLLGPGEYKAYPNHCDNVELFARQDSRNEKKDEFVHKRFVATMMRTMLDLDS